MKLYSHMCISRHAYWQQCIYSGLAYTSKISSRIVKIMLSGRTFALYSVLMSSALINLTWSSLCTHTHISARWQNWEKLLLASSCPSVRPFVYPHGRIRLPLDGFWWNLLFEFFEMFVEKIQVLLKSDKNYGSLHEDIFIFIIIYRKILLGMRKGLGRSCRKIKTHILCSITFLFFQNQAVYEMPKNMVESERRQKIWRPVVAC